MDGCTRVLFGSETEYAVTALGRDGRLLPTEDVADRLWARAGARPSLLAWESGLFLSSGARFYIDGSHPEYASPETVNPWEAVRYALAGDRLMAELAHEVASDDPDIASIVVGKGNIDYSGPATFGSHENYLHRRHPDELRPALVPHLVSRVVMTGAGGFDPFNRKRAQFLLSPRATFIRRLIGSSTLQGLALVDNRAQPHCTGFHRQHLMCGDANQSHLSLLLRFGTTALVVALIDAGCEDDGAVKLAAPLQALTTVARDVTLLEPLELASGRQSTALEIQRHYLRRARCNRACLPAWADAMCDAWEDALDRLSFGPEAVADQLDWAIKRAVFRDRAARRRARWRLEGRAWVEPRPRLVDEKCRAELCEIDFRFGQIYPPGLFEALDETGVLRHRVPGVDRVELAVSTPPAEGRARIRGEVTRRLADRMVGVLCGWDGIRDAMSQRVLDLTSPFTDEEIWRDYPQGPPSAAPLVKRMSLLAMGGPSAAGANTIRTLYQNLRAWTEEHGASGLSGGDAILLNNHAVSLRNARRFEEAEWLMRAALAIDVIVGETARRKLPHRWNNLGTLLLLRGRVGDARREVTHAWVLNATNYDITSARILTVRLTIAMVDNEPGDLFLGQLKTHLAIQPLPDFADVDRRWAMSRMLEMLRPRLDGEAVDLLRAIGEVINRERPLESLDGIPRWQSTPPVPLDEPWPVTVPA